MNKSVIKRILAASISAVVILTCTPSTTYAEYAGGAYMTMTEVEVLDSSAKSKSSDLYARSDFSEYSTNFIYNQLSSKEKEMWNDLDSYCIEYLTTDRNFTDDNVGFVQYATSDMTDDEATNIAYLFALSNPQYYFLNMNFYYGTAKSDKYISCGTYKSFMKGMNRRNASETIFTYVDDIVAQAASLSTEDKLAYFHDEIANHITYKDNGYSQSVYSAVLGEGICAGYSMLFEMMCNASNIDCYCTTSECHQWNKVRINDNWYNVDVTFDDAEGETPYYDYYLKNDKAYKNLAGNTYHIEEDMWDDISAPCSLDSGSTIGKRGVVPKTTGRSAKAKITYEKTAKGYRVTILADKNSKVYYTKNGSSPSVARNKCNLYTKPFTVKNLKALKKIRVITTTPKKLDSKVTKIS